MSNALAIATVTQALALQIENNLRPEIDMAVSVETRKPPAEPPTEPTITVFLYQVVPNTSLRSHDLPTRTSNGTLLKRPTAALDLNFLISAYGEETELVGQRLLGCVVRTLHEMPVLSHELIEQAAQRPYLAGTDLALSPQKVRFTQIQMDIDETSKLWGMLNQTPYVLSVCYQAAVVLVEGIAKPVEPKPVERVVTRVVPSVEPISPVTPVAPAGERTNSKPAAAKSSTTKSSTTKPTAAPTRRRKPSTAKPTTTRDSTTQRGEQPAASDEASDSGKS
jgi:Pvc16 N-terminal domain